MKIAVIGTGYVGLVTGVCLSEYGHEVVCIDSNENKVTRLRAGDPIIFEPGLASLMAQNTANGRLSFTSDGASGVKGAEVVFLAVGTPPHPETGEADMQYIFAAAEQIAPHLEPSAVVVTKSTVPVSTNRKIKALIGNNPIASNPEFLREGSAVKDFMQPERVVVGVEDETTADVLRRLYHPLTLDTIPLIICDLETAEMSKYAANSFLATKVTFINEMADLCEHTGADIRQVAHIMGLDARIGDKFLNPGPGIGGSCFPKDTRALQHTANALGVPFRILESTIEANDLRKVSMAERILASVQDPKSSTIGVLGITFKQNTDDIRESPAITICQELLNVGVTLRIFDPKGMESGKAHFGESARIHWCTDAYDAAQGAETLAILTEWNIFRSLNLPKLKTAMQHPTILDLRNICDPMQMKQAGFDYQCVGKRSG